MTPSFKRYTLGWQWTFAAPRQRTWDVIADTVRLNELAGLGKYQAEDQPDLNGSVVHYGRSQLGPITLEWQRRPTEWVSGQKFIQRTDFSGGPLRSLIFRLWLSEADSTTICHYEIDLEARWLVATPLLPIIAKRVRQAFGPLQQPIRLHLDGDQSEPLATTSSPATDLNARRLAAASKAMIDEGVRPEIVGRLRRLIETGPEADIRRIRPLAISKRWGQAQRDVVEACLIGVSKGLLGMQWDLLCPRCRGGKMTVARLRDLPREGHCTSCNVTYERDFASNVELVFHPSDTIRAIERGEFCLSGPRSTPHVVIQQLLSPGEVLNVAYDLPDGDYRVRPLYGGDASRFTCANGQVPELTFTDDGPLVGTKTHAGRVRLENATAGPAFLVVESSDWVDDALTGHRATTSHVFRTLFGADVLRHDDEARVERITLMFTDLRGSTALYSEIGEAAAYRFVREHFDYLTAHIRRNNGAVVKTIGDAVMAAFADPADALAAATDIQSDIDTLNENAEDIGGRAVAIKIGIHQGPAIAVTLNDKLDYFGTTANMAARLSGLSTGGDIVMSAELAADPAVAEALRHHRTKAESEPIKGFDDPISLVRTWHARSGSSAAAAAMTQSSDR